MESKTGMIFKKDLLDESMIIRISIASNTDQTYDDQENLFIIIGSFKEDFKVVKEN